MSSENLVTTVPVQKETSTTAQAAPDDTVITLVSKELQAIPDAGDVYSVEGSPDDYIAILIKTDGVEYLLLIEIASQNISHRFASNGLELYAFSQPSILSDNQLFSRIDLLNLDGESHAAGLLFESDLQDTSYVIALDNQYAINPIIEEPINTTSMSLQTPDIYPIFSIDRAAIDDIADLSGSQVNILVPLSVQRLLIGSALPQVGFTTTTTSATPATEQQPETETISATESETASEAKSEPPIVIAEEPVDDYIAFLSLPNDLSFAENEINQHPQTIFSALSVVGDNELLQGGRLQLSSLLNEGENGNFNLPVPLPEGMRFTVLDNGHVAFFFWC